MSKHKIDSSRTALVDREYHWNTDMSVCPHGLKVQLRTKWNVAIHGQVTSENVSTFTGWTPLPTERKPDASEADANAPWLTEAHSLCADLGIPPGNISARLAALREKIIANGAIARRLP